MNYLDRVWNIIITSFWPILKAGISVTLPLAIVAFILGLLLGIITALGRMSKIKLLKFVFSTYVWIFRGTPLLVQLFIVFYGLPKVGLQLSAYAAAIITLSLNVGAFCSETIRASILSIPNGQWEAAYSIGMTKKQILYRIIMPQAARVSLPPLSNTFIGLVKETSLVANITIVELFMVSQRIAARTYEPLILYTMAAVVYLLFSTVLTYLQTKLEQRTSRHIRKQVN